MKHLSLTAEFALNNGVKAKNRMWLAPLTNTQSHDDGAWSDLELEWLESRAKGGFGVLISAASHVQENGKSFPGELGSFSDEHITGMRRFAEIGQKHRALSILQLVHGGVRATSVLTGEQPVAPSAVHLNFPGYETPRALLEPEIEAIIAAFVSAAVRAHTAGLNGVEIHAANGYLFTQFLSKVNNRRTDQWGGSSANRARILLETVSRIRKALPRDFVLGVRLLAEDAQAQRGFDIDDTLEVIGWLNEQDINYVHISSGDVRATSWKYPSDAETNLQRIRAVLRKDITLVAAGGIKTRDDADYTLSQGADVLAIGRAAIATFDWPRRALSSGFAPKAFPLSPAELREALISDQFISYLRVHKLVDDGCLATRTSA